MKKLFVILSLTVSAWCADTCTFTYDYTKACDPNTGQVASWFQPTQYGALVNYWWSLASYQRYDQQRLQWWSGRLFNWDTNWSYLRGQGKAIDSVEIQALGPRPDKPCLIPPPNTVTPPSPNCVPRKALVTYNSSTFKVSVVEDGGDPIAKAPPMPPDPQAPVAPIVTGGGPLIH